MIRLERDNWGDEFGVYRAIVSTTSTSDYVLLRPHVDSTSVAVYASTDCYVEYTLSAVDLIDADSAQWITWPLGTVSANSTDSIVSPVTAVRVVSADGESTVQMEVLA